MSTGANTSKEIPLKEQVFSYAKVEQILMLRDRVWLKAMKDNELNKNRINSIRRAFNEKIVTYGKKDK